MRMLCCHIGTDVNQIVRSTGGYIHVIGPLWGWVRSGLIWVVSQTNMSNTQQYQLRRRCLVVSLSRRLVVSSSRRVVVSFRRSRRGRGGRGRRGRRGFVLSQQPLQ